MTPEPERALPADPIRWVREALDEFLWSAQRRIMRALVEHRKVAVASCHGIGKSYVASRGTAWWIAGHPLGEAKAVTTAPSGHQVRSILWGELGKAHRRGNLPGRITHGSTPEWKLGGEQLAFGRKSKDFVNAEEAAATFQGIHARYLLGVIDEACGVPDWLRGAMESLLTNEACRLLAIGNPTDPTTWFAEVCKPGSGWHVIHLSAFDSPAYTGEAVPENLRDSLISKMWVEEVARTYGRTSPYYVARVEGKFPEEASDVIISPRLIREAQERDRSAEALGDRGRFGLDVGEAGDDASALYFDRAGMVREVAVWHEPELDKSRERVEGVLRAIDNGHRPIVVDSVGIGAGIASPLSRKGFRVQRFNGGEQAYDPGRFVNRNSESWWALREQMEAGLIDLDPEDEELAAELQSRKWKLDASQRRIEVEPKPKMASRGVASPNRADAVVMAHCGAPNMVEDVDEMLRRDPSEPRDLVEDLLDVVT